VLGERHLACVLREYCFEYFNQARPHQGIGQLVPIGAATSASGGGEGRGRPRSERPAPRLSEGRMMGVTAGFEGRMDEVAGTGPARRAESVSGRAPLTMSARRTSAASTSCSPCEGRALCETVTTRPGGAVSRRCLSPRPVDAIAGHVEVQVVLV
jgi:hypothetical protein